MTVSIDTTRLSEVITGCGGKETTCSRRSTPARTWSTNGMRKWRPAYITVLNLPSRSTMSATACGTIRTARQIAMTTNRASRTRTTVSTRPPVLSVTRLLFGVGDRHGGDDGGRPVDPHHLDGGAGRQHGAGLRGAGGPDLTDELDAPGPVGDVHEDLGGASDVGGDVGHRVRRGPLEGAERPRPPRDEQHGRDDGEGEDLRPQRGTEERHAPGRQRAAGEHEEDEVDGEHLDDAEHQGPAQPPQPGHRCPSSPSILSTGADAPARYRDAAQRPAARALQRPRWRSTSRSSTKVRDRCCGGRTSSSGPAASTVPARRSRPWLKPGGISSTWWVTSTMTGE